ncbi:TrmH family RNA methyltransferase [Salininema proteolyticum]|uniref:TrmH family RNA methyltransferase n=1 Tax=Salininema proteolyticum TaxID=1607685 RepID=A0ABV8TUW2_9ACTN
MRAPQWITTRNEVWTVVEQLADSGEHRARNANFLADGAETVRVALERGWRPAALLFNSGPGLTEDARDILDRTEAPIYAVAPELMAQLGGRFGSIPEIVAVLVYRPIDLGQIRPHDEFTAVVCGPVADPATVGATMRTAHALGADAVFIDPTSYDPYAPRALHAAGEAFFTLPPVIGYGREQILHWGRSVGGLTVVAVASQGSTGLAEVDVKGPKLVVVADERLGIPEPWLRAADIVVSSPAAGAGLDATALTAMCLPEVKKQRQAAPAAPPTAFPEPDDADSAVEDADGTEDEYRSVNYYAKFRRN